MYEKISLRWAEERARIGFTQADMARKLDVSRETMRKWENGLGVPSTEALIAAYEYGIDVQYVLTGVRNLPQRESSLPTGVVMNGVSGVGIASKGASVHVINTQRYAPKTIAEVKPGSEHISDAQAATLLEMVNQIVELEQKLRKKPASHRSVWATLNRYCGVPQYRLIAAAKFGDARAYLHQWIGRLSSMASAPVKDGDAWRKRKYAYIKVNSRDPEDAEALARYIGRNFGATSLTELANDQLEAAYRYVAGRKTKRKSF